MTLQATRVRPPATGQLGHIKSPTRILPTAIFSAELLVVVAVAVVLPVLQLSFTADLAMILRMECSLIINLIKPAEPLPFIPAETAIPQLCWEVLPGRQMVWPELVRFQSQTMVLSTAKMEFNRPAFLAPATGL